MGHRCRISLLIPVYNGGEKFRQCLGGVLTAQPPPWEVIVIADGDPDSAALARSIGGLQVLTLPRTQGPAHARNIGAMQAHGDILFFVDADVVIEADALRQITTAFHDDESLTALFGLYDEAPAERNFFSQYKNLLHHFTHRTAREDAATFWAGCGAIRREAFVAIGGFNEQYRTPAIEDIELGCRLSRAGYRIRVLKSLQCKHLKRWSIGSLLRSDIFHRALPWTALILRERQIRNDLNLTYASRLSVVLVYGLGGMLIGSWYRINLLYVAGGMAGALLMLNAALYRFFWRKHGAWFVLRAIGWHWFSYAYSGAAFLWGCCLHLRRVGTGWVGAPGAGTATPTR
jgi:glycosyltransferase involved in cell wall biosynthesis